MMGFRSVEIPLTQGKWTCVDLEDASVILCDRWFAFSSPDRNTSYAVRKKPWGKGRQRQRIVYLHRFLLNAKGGEEVDHRDGNGLRNRRSNLRLCTRTKNRQNQRRNQRRVRAKKTSAYKGVSYYKRTGRWMACIGLNGLTHHLGYFSTPEEAAAAYDTAAKQMFGEFAAPNSELGDPR